MLALSRLGDRMFLHQPEDGLAVPVIVDFDKKSIDIGIPDVEELANDYAIYDELDDAVRAAGRGHGKLIRQAYRFSRRYTKQFSSQIEAGDLTVVSLRKLVNNYIRRVKRNQITETSGLAPSETTVIAPPRRSRRAVNAEPEAPLVRRAMAG